MSFPTLGDGHRPRAGRRVDRRTGARRAWILAASWRFFNGRHNSSITMPVARYLTLGTAVYQEEDCLHVRARGTHPKAHHHRIWLDCDRILALAALIRGSEFAKDV
jgi:hypothetical protein